MNDKWMPLFTNVSTVKIIEESQLVVYGVEQVSENLAMQITKRVKRGRSKATQIQPICFGYSTVIVSAGSTGRHIF